MPPAKTDASPAELARALELFLADHPRAALLEDGRVLFDMQAAHYSLSAEHGRCVLHLWSEERNLVRTIVGLEPRKDSLRLQATRFGQARPQALQLVTDRDQRTPSTRTAMRTKYLRLLERVLTRSFPDLKVDGLRTAMDLEHSFGPAYTRGFLVRGNSAFAIIGVNSGESQATIDGILTLGILWLAHCREHADSRRLVQGLKVFLPAGTAELTRSRMSALNPELAKWELYELDEREELLTQVEIHEGNLQMRMLRAFRPEATMERCTESVERLMALLPPGVRERVQLVPRSPTEVGFLLHGLEFARARQGFSGNSFAREELLTFGAGANETPLNDDTQALFVDLLRRLALSRQAGGSVRDPLYRLQSERWMESVLKDSLAEIIPGVQQKFVYTQVPAFAGGDRGMLDLLTADRNGRLIVIELKADEDLHLPLQGLDYWLRVRWLNQQGREREGAGEFERNGYFLNPQLQSVISCASPMLCFVAPALRIHPANEVVLKHLSTDVQWTLIAIGEQWRDSRQVIFRKHSAGRSTI